MSKSLSKLQQDILQAAQENGGTLTYERAYELFFPRFGVMPAEPLKNSGSHQDREDRAQRLANLFIGEMVPLLVSVRQDFWDKDRDETICGVKTFTEYCTAILRYSAVHIRRLIAGQNPATALHDGSANRKPEPSEPESTAVGDLRTRLKTDYPEIFVRVQKSVVGVAERFAAAISKWFRASGSSAPSQRDELKARCRYPFLPYPKRNENAPNGKREIASIHAGPRKTDYSVHK